MARHTEQQLTTYAALNGGRKLHMEDGKVVISPIRFYHVLNTEYSLEPGGSEINYSRAVCRLTDDPSKQRSWLFEMYRIAKDGTFKRL